jgi:quercetin dioxygenase-like cupin family protein
MGYTKVNYTETEPVSDAMHFLREPLGCREMGVTITRCEPDWHGVAHDHADDGHEEVYILISGKVTVRVNDEDVSMNSGDAVWMSPETTRQIRNGDAESALVLVSAPELDTSDDSDGAEWILTGVQG